MRGYDLRVRTTIASATSLEAYRKRNSILLYVAKKRLKSGILKNQIFTLLAR